MKKSESIIELAKALAKFQGEVKQPKKDKSNPFFKSTYVDLAGVVDAITETSSKNGLSFMQHALTGDNGEVGVITIVLHESGEYIESSPIFAKPMKPGPQEVGSVLTYLKRYSLASAFGITSEVDDDGENGMSRSSNQQSSYQQNNYRQQQPKQQTNSDNISDAQTKALKAKLSNISKNTGVDAKNVYVGALKTLNIPESLNTKDLSKAQATKLIAHLAEKEKEFAS